MTNAESVCMSVVLPVYNVERYLGRCLDSILSQGLQRIEAICVNDASTDGSRDVLDGYAKRDARVKVIHFPENLGVGAARNAGIRAAQGETICFVDPDDYLPEGSLETRAAAYAKCKTTLKGMRVDMTPQGVVTRYDAYSEERTRAPFCPKEDLLSIDLLDHHQAWLFPTDLLRRNGITYKEGMRNGQDLYFLAKLYYFIDAMLCINAPTYCLVHRQGSATNRRLNIDNYINILRCAEAFYEESVLRNKLLFGDYYFNKRIVHALTRITENSINDVDVNAEFDRFIEYGLYLFQKFGVIKRYKKPGYIDAFPGIKLLAALVHEPRGGIAYRIRKANQKMATAPAKPGELPA